MILMGILAVVRPVWGQDSGSPHYMRLPDGKPDKDKCPLCHEEDNETLSRSKVETCTLCHNATPHAGAAEHLAASAANVGRRLASAKDIVKMPLTDDGRIYCGTCHFFHDPVLAKEQQLPNAWLPGAAGLSEAVKSARKTTLDGIAPKYEQSEPGFKFMIKGTKALRLPVEDGSLCRHCHGDR